MPARLTTAEREEKGRRAYALSLQGCRVPDIAADLQVSDTTVDNLLRRERQCVRARREKQQGADDLTQFLDEQNWAMQQSAGKKSRNSASHIANYIAASKNKAQALGLFVERKDITSNGEPLADLFRKPIEVHHYHHDDGAGSAT